MSTLHTKLTFLFLRIKSHSRPFMVVHRFCSQEAKPPLPLRQVPREKPAFQKKSNGIPLLIIPLTALGLGTWQIQRREWKLKLIKNLEDKMQTPPVLLPEDLNELKNMEYRKVKVRGTFDHSRELFIGPRTNLHAPATTARNNKTATMGLHVVTPFKLADRDETILVNRGHVKFQDRPPQSRLAGQIEEEVELVGIVRLSDKNKYLRSNPLKDGFWLSREVDEMAEIAGTSCIYLDADLDSSVPGGPVGGQTIISLRNDHLTYIITWYSLAAITFFLWWKNYKTGRLNRSVIEFFNNGMGKTGQNN